MLAAAYPQHEIYPVPVGDSQKRELYPTSNTIPGMLHPRHVDDCNLVMGHFKFDQLERLLPEWRIFTFLRYPIERFMSHYRYLCQEVSHPQHALVKNMTFDEYMAHPFTKLNWDNIQTRYLSGALDGQPITEEHYRAASVNLHCLDYIGFVEDFDRHWWQIRRRYGLPKCDTRHDNRTVENRLTLEQMQAVLQRERYDIQLYREAERLKQR
jgi:hypothetical protein